MNKVHIGPLGEKAKAQYLKTFSLKSSFWDINTFTLSMCTHEIQFDLKISCILSINEIFEFPYFQWQVACKRLREIELKFFCILVGPFWSPLKINQKNGLTIGNPKRRRGYTYNLAPLWLSSFLILSMVVILPLSRPSRIILVVTLDEKVVFGRREVELILQTRRLKIHI